MLWMNNYQLIDWNVLDFLVGYLIAVYINCIPDYWVLVLQLINIYYNYEVMRYFELQLNEILLLCSFLCESKSYFT